MRMSTLAPALALALPAVLLLAPGADAQPETAPDVCVGADADAACEDAAASGTGDARCESPGCAAVSGDGRASCQGEDGACVAISGTSTASCQGYICVVASGAGDAAPDCWSVGHCVAVSGAGDAHPACPETGACVAASGAGDAQAEWVAVSGTGEATCGSGPFGSDGPGCVAASGCDVDRVPGPPDLCQDPDPSAAGAGAAPARLP